MKELSLLPPVFFLYFHTTALTILLTPDMYGDGGGFPHQAILCIPAGCVLQFNSILTLSTWRQHQIQQVRPSPVRLPPTSDANHNQSVPRLLTTSVQLDCESGVSMTFSYLDLIICQNSSQNSGKHLHLPDHSMVKAMIKGRDEQPNEEIQMAGSERVPSTGAWLSFPTNP